MKNGKQSEDSITTFSTVRYPDPKLTVNAESWKGGKSIAIVGKRIGMPGAADGGIALWLCPEARPLLPGAGTTFALQARARPGFTVASTEHFPHIRTTSDEWPEQTLDELDPVCAPAWIDQHLITLGPRYGPTESRATIAASFLADVRALMVTRHLDPDSRFLKSVIANLGAIAGGYSMQAVLTDKPKSEIETELLTALRLSLHIYE